MNLRSILCFKESNLWFSNWSFPRFHVFPLSNQFPPPNSFFPPINQFSQPPKGRKGINTLPSLMTKDGRTCSFLDEKAEQCDRKRITVKPKT
uniref:Uncharacterized protein n=1 Tax=Glossina pallidipes TaxID=7398 RepID=A0A1A9ZVM0_GLOPL